MPFPFDLPTTGALSLSTHVTCESHPSLILAASTRRNVVRTTLKAFKRSPASARAASLPAVLAALEDYIPYLTALDDGLSGKPVAGEEVHAILEKEIELDWRPCLAPSIPGRPTRGVKGKGLDFEICFVLATLGYTLTLLAREKLRGMYREPAPDAEQRTAGTKAANQYLGRASAIHTYLSTRSAESGVAGAAKEISAEVQAGLAAMALAEANLAVILKDDPYPAIVLQSRSKDDNEWMYKAPTLPKVRARLYGHGSLAAAELAAKSTALLGSSVDDDLAQYAKQLQRTSKAKACRFFGMDAELGGKTGEGIGWLRAARKELGLKIDDEGKSVGAGLSRLKQGWKERREDKKIKKGEEWGMDAGQIEESRIVVLLDEQWSKANNMMIAQIIPAADSLVANMPSGRELTHADVYRPPQLDAQALASMRGPVNVHELARVEGGSDDNSDNDGEIHAPGSFPESSSASRYY